METNSPPSTSKYFKINKFRVPELYSSEGFLQAAQDHKLMGKNCDDWGQIDLPNHLYMFNNKLGKVQATGDSYQCV